MLSLLTRRRRRRIKLRHGQGPAPNLVEGREKQKLELASSAYKRCVLHQTTVEFPMAYKPLEVLVHCHVMSVHQLVYSSGGGGSAPWYCTTP